MKLFSIFGNPVSHSISPLLHNSAIKALTLNACYGRFLLEEGEEIIRKFNSLNLSGANVTIPHKEWAYKKCDEAKGIAKNIEAVNTLVKEDNKVIGYNTDAPGFYESIKEFKEIKNALILGAGGTTKAIAYILREKGINVTILNRSSKRLEFFQNRGFECYSWDDFSPENYSLVINATSAGLNNNSLPYEEKRLKDIFNTSKYAIDIIYGKETPFLKLAKSNNLTCKNGKDMLLYQAVLAFNLFYGNRLSQKIIEESMKKVF